MNKRYPQIAPVILCGGSGTRLWPMSRESYPKQFVDLGEGSTLFKDTLKRVIGQDDYAAPLIICNEKYRFYVSQELERCKARGTLVLEPAPRNTAPALALAALACAESENEPAMLVMPSDHQLNETGAFLKIVAASLPLARQGRIVTFGITPTRPATGYGYIGQGQPLEFGYEIERFLEKPDPQTARELLATSKYFWNAGIFLMRPSVYLRELQTWSPEIYEACQAAWEGRSAKGNWISPDTEAFLACPEDSIDYAVMEKTGRGVMVPMDLQWDDFGSWEAFYRFTPKDGNNNACRGEVILEDVRDSYIRSTDRLIAAIGVSGLTIVETKDAILVASREKTQKVKNIVRQLKQRDSYKYKHHPLVYRPWGSYETLATGHRFQVKRIVVNPGGILSLQMHHHRTEHWIIVSGTAEITNGDNVTLYTENQSTYIPVGCRHRLRNPGIIPLVLIEIQSGSYLGEDDIVRFEDIYGR